MLGLGTHFLLGLTLSSQKGFCSLLSFLILSYAALSHVVFPSCWDVSGWQMVRGFTLQTLKLKYFPTFTIVSLHIKHCFPTGSQFQCDTSAMTDIVLLVDGSWSIGRSNFKLIKEFLSALISPFNIAQDKIRVGKTLPCFLTLGNASGTDLGLCFCAIVLS